VPDDDPPRGWYPDPDPGAPDGQRRYWDGHQWHQEVAGPHNPNGGLVAAGYILAVLFPPVGFLIGIVLGAKGNRHAAWVVVLSVGVTLISIAVLS
jgi:hypothetical protein